MTSLFSALLFCIFQLPLELCLAWKFAWKGHGHIFKKADLTAEMSKYAHVLSEDLLRDAWQKFDEFL